MFPKGSRFPALKPSEVPGPGAYNPQEPQVTYKHGAMLEKAERFNEDKPSDVPGPGAYNTDKNGKPVKKGAGPANQADRYAALQKKLEDLERVHLEGKKAHQVEQERLKQELSHLQKASTDQSEQLTKVKKQNEALDARVQELKKSSATEQAELKDLRVKFRLLEHERTQLASKQGEAGEAKKALGALDAKRRDELRDRDRRIVELEKSAAAEKRRREAAEARLEEVTGKVDREIGEARDTQRRLETLAAEATREAKDARDALEAVEQNHGAKKGELLEQLELVRSMLRRAAEEYGRLVATTVPASAHTSVKRELAISQINGLRLERKLANTEDQVHELAHLIRQTKDQKSFLSAQLREAEDEASYLCQALQDTRRDSRPPSITVSDLDVDLANLQTDALRLQLEGRSAVEDIACLINTAYRLNSSQLLFACSALDRDLRTRQQELQTRVDELKRATLARETLGTQLQSLRAQQEATQKDLVAASAHVEELRANQTCTKQQLESAETRLREEAAKQVQALQKEKETTKKMAATVQKSKASEDALKIEIEQLTAELMDVIPYQEAFTNLKDEVGSLIARNALAEEEAENLSKFNAEILGHRNPSQRIMYVDRIRRELAETKQKLLLANRDHEVALADADDLRHELDMYKSVAVPTDNKPRTGMTRIGRIPLVNQSTNVKPASSSVALFGKSAGVSGKKLDIVDEQEYLPGDMTVDELR